MRYYLLVIGIVATLSTPARSQSISMSMLRTSADSGVVDCHRLHNYSAAQASTPEEYQIIFDSLHYYVEHCAASDGDESYQAFGGLDRAVQWIDPSDPLRFKTYRDWLISVVYLNTTNPLYFCSCVRSIGESFQDTDYLTPNSTLAVYKFLMHQSECTDSTVYFAYDLAVRRRHEAWLNGDTTKPEDTTLPSLESLGLGFLLHNGVPRQTEIASGAFLGSVTATPNPFTKETEILFSLNRMAYTTIQVFDILGRMVWNNGSGHSYESGQYSIRIDGASVPSGTLYVRVSTGFGEVKSVKLVHTP